MFCNVPVGGLECLAVDEVEGAVEVIVVEAEEEGRLTVVEVFIVEVPSGAE